jgi:hypothetical protein
MSWLDLQSVVDGIDTGDYDDERGTLEQLDRTAQLRNRLLDVQALRTMPEPTWLVDGYLLRNSLALVYGRRGSYKSFLALDWSLCIASGRDWFGHATVQVPGLYVAAEGASGIAKRVDAWEVENGPLGGVPITFLPQAVNLLDASWADAIAEVCEEQSAGYVVIDTVARDMPGGDENSSRDMGQFVAGIDRIRERTGACVLSIHHPPRAGGNPRGSTALEGAMDTIIECSAEGGELTLRMEDPVGKQKDAAPAADLTLKVKVVGDSLTGSCVLVEHDGSATDVSPAMVEMLHALEDTDTGSGVTTTQWQKVTANAVSGRTFYRHRKRLLELRLTANIGTERQQRYTIAEQGRIALRCHTANVLPPTATAPDSANCQLPPPIKGGSSGSNQRWHR